MSRPETHWWMRSSQSEAATPREQISLPDETLLQICRASIDDADTMPQWMDDLRSVPLLIYPSGYTSNLSYAVTMLAFLLGEMPKHNPVHLPFGYSGPQTRSSQWIDQDTLDRISKQLMGLVRHDLEPAKVALEIECAISEACRLGFMEMKDYDAWRPGMASGSGWRSAVMATLYGVTKARAVCATLCTPRPQATPSIPQTIHVAPTEPTPPAPHPWSKQSPPASQPVQEVPKSESTDDKYLWARQIELINAANQVLGEGSLHKGVLSRACGAKLIQTNGQSGRASRVSVPHFLTWLIGQCPMGSDEQLQVRNAIVGQIMARNS